LAAAVRSLFRIRAYESTDATGLRRVWHQGTEGADLLTWVNADGTVARQELTLLDDHFVWTPEGFRTATLDESDGARAVRFDPQISRERVSAAHVALREYPGDDKYILNMRRIIAKTMGELMEGAEFVMTKNVPVPGGGESSSSGRALFYWAGIALALAAAAAAILALR